MVVLHLRARAVATFNRRRGPLKRLGMLSRPRFPVRQHLRWQLPRTRMSLTCLFDRLEYERDLGLLPWTARAAQLFVPVHQGQQPIFRPLGPPRCHGQLRQVLTYRLPPDVDQNRYPCKLLLDLAQGVVFHRQPVGRQHRFDRLELGSSLLLNLRRCRASRVRQPPGMQDARHIGQALPPGTAHLLPVMDRGGPGHYRAWAWATWAGSALVFFCTFSRCCVVCSSSRLACRSRPQMASAERLARS